MELNLAHKNIVVTGGANGLCHDIAKAYYEAGGNLCIMEWPENIEELLPEETLRVHIIVNPDNSRTLRW